MADNSSIFNNRDRPWLSIVVPLTVFLGIAVLVFSYKTIRRRERMRAALQGRRALDRDLENQYHTGRYRRFPTTVNLWHNPGPSIYAPDRTPFAAQGPEPAQDRVRTANRWAWATNLNPRAARREEGLNELGEAPPPYDQNASRKEEGVPLRELPSSRDRDAERGTGGGHREDGNAAPVTGWSALNSPPAYGENGVGRPPPAVLPTSQRHG